MGYLTGGINLLTTEEDYYTDDRRNFMNPLNRATLEASKRLYDAGIALETEAVWALVPDLYNCDPEGDPIGRWKLISEPLYPYKEQIPAPCMAEVWRELPKVKQCKYSLTTKQEESRVTTGYENRGSWLYYVRDTNPTDALIDLLIWVTEQRKGRN